VSNPDPSFRSASRPRPPTRALDNYGTVLALLIATFVMIPIGEGVIWRVLLSLSLSMAVLTTYRASNVKARTMAAVTWFVGVVMVGSLAASVTRDSLIDEWVLIPVGLLLLAGPWVILARVLAHRTVTTQTIVGAICAYVYFGLIFAFAYGLTDAVTSDPFFAQGPIIDPGRFSYFSFVTLTTLGYGDLSPASAFGQNLAVIEALTGSIYLVTLVGRLVGLYGNQGSDGTRESATVDKAGD